MIDVNGLSVSFSGTTLFSDLNFKLTQGDRVGLIGKNGVGKSTLLKIITGDIEYEGLLSIEKNTRIGFLRQDIDFGKGYTILQETYKAFAELQQIEQNLEYLHNQIETRTDYESESYQSLLHELGELNHRYEIAGGYKYKGETEKILRGLGFKSTDFDKPTDTFSGGWRMRIELAKILLQNNDVLLLDEPTNHLDIDSILWFEQFLKSYTGVVLLVSHDKMFLDEVTNRTIEISLGGMYDFKKPYSKYLEVRQELLTTQIQAQKNQEKQIKHTEQLIEKFRYKASKAAFAQSLIKKLEKVERIEVDVEDTSTMNISFPIKQQSGKVVFTLQNISKYYGAKKVLENINLQLQRGDKMAFVGQNGMGKTTLAKILLEEIDYTGTVTLGHNVDVGYFAQNQSDYLNPENDLVEEMETIANDSNRIKIRSLLGSFLFKGDDVYKKVKVLSGGERNRLALCKLMLNPHNVLIMDEPTNHLDISSKNVLKTALQNYQGTLILVSHDRDFLQGLVQKVYEFRDYNIKIYLGGIDYYLEQRQFDNFRQVEMKVEEIGNEQDNEKKSLSYEEQKEQKKILNKISKIETEITKLENLISEKDKILADDTEMITKNPSFFDDYQQLKSKLENLLEQWSSLQESISN